MRLRSGLITALSWSDKFLIATYLYKSKLYKNIVKISHYVVISNSVFVSCTWVPHHHEVFHLHQRIYRVPHLPLGGLSRRRCIRGMWITNSSSWPRKGTASWYQPQLFPHLAKWRRARHVEDCIEKFAMAVPLEGLHLASPARRWRYRVSDYWNVHSTWQWDSGGHLPVWRWHGHTYV